MPPTLKKQTPFTGGMKFATKISPLLNLFSHFLFCRSEWSSLHFNCLWKRKNGNHLSAKSKVCLYFPSKTGKTGLLLHLVWVVKKIGHLYRKNADSLSLFGFFKILILRVFEAEIVKTTLIVSQFHFWRSDLR